VEGFIAFACYWQDLLLILQTRVSEIMQTFPDWPPGARTANGKALCHYVELYRYFVSQSSEFCSHNPLCCFLTSVYCCYCCLFRYGLRPETFGYTLVSHIEGRLQIQNAREQGAEELGVRGRKEQEVDENYIMRNFTVFSLCC
jgi:hypothetical protein